MIDATEKIIKRTKNIYSIDDFLVDDSSLMLLDSLCMQLIAIGEAVKKIDKLTDKKLLKNYPNTPWREIAGMRDILSHHYFDLNSEVVFEVSKEHIADLGIVLTKILVEIEE
ncbi:MAG: antitoxin [Epsilonproteobacteria bacterium]|nr:MAG: antitoxin [Campylobacterota bacterium]